MSVGHHDEPMEFIEERDKNTLSIATLTISEFKDIIRQIVREEIAKCNFKEVHHVPVREQWYGPPQYPWQQQVWCDSNYSKNDEIIG